jgi:hypothetical protein
MNTAFALAPGTHGTAELLSGRDLIGHGIRASHVTVQACSLGRGVAAAGDEMWGPPSLPAATVRPTAVHDVCPSQTD